MEVSNIDNLEKKIEKWKKDLLDKGANSSMVNLRQTRHTLQISYPSDISYLYNSLAQEEDLYEFPLAPKKHKKFEENSLVQNNEESSEEITIFDPGSYEPIDSSCSTMFAISSKWKTKDHLRELQTSLKYLRSKSKTYTEETGLHNLYLTFGILNWFESDNSQIQRRSPIVIVPVNLIKQSFSSPFILEKHEEEILVNPTLQYRLEHDFNITIPPFSEDEDISHYLDTIESLIKDNSDWVIERVSYLSPLSFSKIIMYKDIEQHEYLFKRNSVLTQLAGIQSDIPQTSFSGNSFDHDTIASQNVFQVLDADSSQLDAIENAKKGDSFVLQGPPGTGKSQTITNIIVELLGMGKKVLFVSEKMAALDVVSNRIEHVGLKDYTLTLHSQKGSSARKALVNNLMHCFRTEQTIENQEKFNEFYYSLETKKRKLIDYVTEIKNINEPLGMSMYDIHGELVKLSGVEKIIDINEEHLSRVSQRELHSALELIRQAGELHVSLIRNPNAHVWKDHGKVTLSLRLNQNISMYGNILISLYKPLPNIAKAIKEMGFHSLKSINDLIPFVSIFSDLREAKPILPVWENRVDLSNILRLIEQEEIHKDNLNLLINNISKNYYQELLTKDYIKFKQLLEKEKLALLTVLGVSIENPIPDIAALKDSLSSLSTLIDNSKEISRNIAQLFPNSERESLEVLIRITPSYSLWLNLFEMPSIWLTSPSKFRLVKSTFEEAQGLFLKMKDLEEILNKDYTGSYEDENWIELQSWNNLHTSFFVRLSPTYKKLIKKVRTHYMHKVDKRNVSDVLKTLADYQQSKILIEKNNAHYKDIFSEELYSGKYTCWITIENLIKNVETMFVYHEHGYPIQITRNIIENLKKDSHKNSQHLALYTRYIKNLHKLVDEIPEDSHALKSKIYSCNLREIRKLILEFDNSVKNIKTILHEYELNTVSINNNLFSQLSDLDTFDKTKKAYINLGTKVLTKLNLPIDFKIDWCSLKERLEWARELFSKDYYKEVSSVLKDTLFKADGEFVAKLKSIYEELASGLSILQSESYQFFSDLFLNQNMWKVNEFITIIEKLEKCIKNVHLLEDSIEFDVKKNECDAIPLLEGTINQLEEKGVPGNEWVDVCKKSFFTQLRDSYMENYPTLSFFKLEEHQQIIDEFKELDVKQHMFASLRVKLLLDSKRPANNGIMGGEDSILRKEDGKKRKFKSVRRLFAEIPHLLMDMKPCLLMSPLAVSQYLHPELYEFDTVIFDEASQIKTQDAVSSILRAKQSIIVGDKKQLPPTTFFEASESDEDYDSFVGDDEEDSGILDTYESVLEEASFIFPSPTLRWHYRSRYEQLIMFSNSELYDNALITFPSHTQNYPNTGVEFVYVPNGIYDKGKSRKNLIEAEKVADLIFEHFSNFPNRSLGVVTCSQSQQQCIEDVLEKRRDQNRIYERFFDESKEESFFIKNIETVQGDERDTIFFSIGYGPSTLHGPVPMMFGPINRLGGERRLNVAITRAKENVKLICSFHPSEVKVGNSNSLGAKKLLNYIKYAEIGPDSLAQPSALNSTLGGTESVFEDSVKEYLESKGYTIIPQVGCSSYRIDLGLVNPTNSTEYILGIECDGAQYHSSRTARERDRLRQSLLEGMGWNIYRIWSTDWIKDPFGARERLLQAVATAIQSGSMVNSRMHKKNNIECSADLQEDFFIHEEISELLPDDNLTIENVQLQNLPKFVDFCPNTKFTSINEVLTELPEYLQENQPITVDYFVQLLRDRFFDESVLRKLKKVPSLYISAKTGLFADNYGSIWYDYRDYEFMTVPRRNTDENGRGNTNSICFSEVIGLCYLCVKSFYGPTTDEIVNQYKQVFNYKRAGKGINGTISSALDLLVNKNLIIQRVQKWYISN